MTQNSDVFIFLMSFNFQPQSENSGALQQPAPPLQRRLSWIPICVILAIVAGFIGWNPAKRSIRDAWARSHAREAIVALEADDMGHAIAELIDARKLSPEEPEVLHATIQYLKLAKGDRRELAYHLRLLATKRPLSNDDQLLYGSCLLELGRIDEARRVHAALSSDANSNPKALTLLAQLQAAEGQSAAAIESASKARLLDKQSPEARLQLAIENSRSSFPEYRNQSWIELWSLCQLPPPVGIAAARAILLDARLTAEDAKRLLPIVEAHPHGDLAIRLDIVSALIGFFPDQKSKWVDQEVLRFETEKSGTLIEMAAWLASHGEHARLLKLIPPQLASSSKPLFTALIKGLAGEDRWQEMKQLLTSQRPPVPNTLVSIWLADAESHLQPDMKESRRQLGFAIESAIAARELEELELAAKLSERLGMPDLALKGLLHLASSVEPRRTEFLLHTKKLAEHSKNTPALLEAARALHELNPANKILAEELSYLRLLLGQEMEMVHNQATQGQTLYKALAAYRLGDRSTLQNLMSMQPKSDGLSAGRRAVLSGLLAKTGQAAAAFQIAEKVPEALLLDEEVLFLKLAR